MGNKWRSQLNNYKEWANKYIEKGFSVIPDKWADKKPAIEGWNLFADKLPTKEEVEQWSETFTKSNIAVVLGPQSGIVALDIDTDRPDILEIFKVILPNSPVTKRGSKGYTAFFRYTNNRTEQLKFGPNKDVILEILSVGKKSTLPPSRHPNGADYIWTSESTLLDIDIEALPTLPPMLVSTCEMLLKQKFGDEAVSGGKVATGRNSSLGSELGKFLAEPHTTQSIIEKLIQFDYYNNKPAYFTDLSEHQHGDAVSNALLFYATHMQSINSRRHRENKEYLAPLIELESESATKKSESKLTSKAKLKKSHEFILANTAVKTIFDTINANSWVKQPELAMAAILALGAVLASRKFMFQGMTTNLYLSVVSLSGTGKNAGLEFVKTLLMELGADKYLGAGDMASDAGITDSLAMRSTQLYIMDEIGGILKTINNGKAEYNGKMADILAELYTSSTSRYLGRALAEGVKGAVDRPHLSILGATTPTGFQQGVSKQSLDKGLMGRFLIFFGDDNVESTRVKNKAKLPLTTMNQLQWLIEYKPEDNEKEKVAGRDQLVTELKISEEADKRLDEIFKEFDKIRLANRHEDVSPIAARLYQQMIKIVIIHALLNANRQVPVIQIYDVNFGYNVILANFEQFKTEINGLLADTPIEKQREKILRIIGLEGDISKANLIKRTPEMIPLHRNSLLADLIEASSIQAFPETIDNKLIIKYREI